MRKYVIIMICALVVIGGVSSTVQALPTVDLNLTGDYVVGGEVEAGYNNCIYSLVSSTCHVPPITG